MKSFSTVQAVSSSGGIASDAQLLVAAARAEDFVLGEVVDQRAVASVDGQRFVGRELRHAAPLEAAGEAVRPLAEDLDDIGHMDDVAFALRHGDFHLRVKPARRAEPALQHLRVDADGEDVDARSVPCAAASGPARADRKTVPLIGREPEMPELARVAVAQQLLKKLAALHAVRRRAEHRDQLRTRLRGGEHLAPLAQIHRHARLTENVLARLERRDRDRRVQDRRRADPDDVEVGPVEHLGPVVHDFGNVKFLRDALGRFDSRIADRDDLHVGQRQQAGQMPLPDDAARADDADPQFFRRACFELMPAPRVERARANRSGVQPRNAR